MTNTGADMHTITLEKGLATFLDGLHGKNRSSATIRAYQTDAQFIGVCSSVETCSRRGRQRQRQRGKGLQGRCRGAESVSPCTRDCVHGEQSPENYVPTRGVGSIWSCVQGHAARVPAQCSPVNGWTHTWRDTKAVVGCDAFPCYKLL